jgi:hypothetical protein
MIARPRSLLLVALSASLLATACGSGSPSTQESTVTLGGDASLWPTKKIGAKPPYIVQEGCKFFLVTESGTISTTSERDSGPSGNATLNMGGERMVLSSCTLAENPGKLPVY